MPGTLAPRRHRAVGHADGTGMLSSEERQAVEQGRLFGLLTHQLKEIILGRAYVWRLKDGEQLLAADAPVEHWIGVAGGELLGRTASMETGEKVASHVLGPGAWLNNYSPLCPIRHRGVEFVASGPTCLLALDQADLLDICARWPELVTSMLAVAAMNLRYVQLLVQDFQVGTLERKLLRWLDSAVGLGVGTRDDSGWLYRSVVSQAALAAAVGVSRQSWNAAMARLEAAGVIQRVKGGLRVPDLARFDATLERSGLRDTAAFIRPEAQPDQPTFAMECEALPIDSLRDDERAALGQMRWYQHLSAPLRETLLSSLQVLRPREGEMLAKADRAPAGWMCVIRGGIRLMSPAEPHPAEAASPDAGTPAAAPRAPHGRTIFAQLQPGATFFEYALVDGGVCGLDACSERDTTLLLMPGDAFRELLASDAGFRAGTLKWTSYSHHQMAMLKMILTLPMPLRLHAWLDLLGRQRGRSEGGWLTISMSLSQQDIAGWLSTTRQYVAKAVAELERDGRLVRRRESYLLRRDALPLASRHLTVGVLEDGVEES
jgi:CRP/FNR family transcriptional regulator, cyclic AMP receptor protein